MFSPLTIANIIIPVIGVYINLGFYIARCIPKKEGNPKHSRDNQGLFILVWMGAPLALVQQAGFIH